MPIPSPSLCRSTSQSTPSFSLVFLPTPRSPPPVHDAAHLHPHHFLGQCDLLMTFLQLNHSCITRSVFTIPKFVLQQDCPFSWGHCQLVLQPQHTWHSPSYTERTRWTASDLQIGQAWHRLRHLPCSNKRRGKRQDRNICFCLCKLNGKCIEVGTDIKKKTIL